MIADDHRPTNDSAHTAPINQLPRSVSSSYVIQRSSEIVREWWTGEEWSDDFLQAKEYDTEPDAGTESDDEMAIAIKRSDVDD